MDSVPLNMEEEIGGTQYGKQTPKSAYREYFSSGILCLCMILILTAILIGSIGLARSDRAQAQIQSDMSLRQKIAQHDAESLPFAGRSISLSNAYKTGKPRVLLLCAMATYHRMDANASLKVLSETIDEIVETPLQSHSFYHVSVQMRLTFTELAKKKKLKTTETLSESTKRAILLEYNVTSNFATFSTVKLQELEFETRRHSLRALRTIVLCSSTSTQRCDETTENTTVIMSGEEELSFDIPQLPGFNQKVDGNDDDEEEEIALISDILGIRMYNLVFYEKKSINNDSVMEKKILTIEPNKCY
jgi:hypothetical protein